MRMSGYVKKFLKVADLMDGPIVSHIARVAEGAYGKPDMQLETGETLSLNVTNLVTLIKAFGDDSDLWAGQKIELHLGETEYQGKMVATVMVRPLSGVIDEAARRDIIEANNKIDGDKRTRNSDMNDDIPV